MKNKENVWNETYLKTTMLLAENSKCSAKKVACVIVKNNNIVSIGLNGTLSGKENCNDKFEKKNGDWYKKIETYDKRSKDFDKSLTLLKVQNDSHSKWSSINEIHAEINALANANKNGVSVIGADAYVTYSPCINCAKTLTVFGIKNIFYIHDYDDIKEVEDYLKENSVNIQKMILK